MINGKRNDVSLLQNHPTPSNPSQTHPHNNRGGRQVILPPVPLPSLLDALCSDLNHRFTTHYFTAGRSRDAILITADESTRPLIIAIMKLLPDTDTLELVVSPSPLATIGYTTNNTKGNDHNQRKYHIVLSHPESLNALDNLLRQAGIPLTEPTP
jgi:hypothetical protein